MSTPRAAGWIVSPAFDLCFLANVGWLLALAPGFVAADGTVHVEFWQIYFLTAPHRWLTLLLVASDPDRRAGRAWLFAALALAAALLVAGVWLGTGAFLCLAVVDYVWNGWHFASQHAGVLRMYARKAGGGHPWLERHGLRLFMGYVIARTAAWATGWLDDFPALAAALPWADGLVLALAALLVGLELLDPAAGRLPKRVYLVSVCGLYALLLLALRFRWGTQVVALAVAAATFHAVEYLAVVTHYAWRRREHGSAGLFRRVAGHWLTFLLGYALLLGLSDLLIRRHLAELWAGLNLWAGLLHYAYDGMIWKLRRPETSRALGVEAAPTSAEAARAPVTDPFASLPRHGRPVTTNLP